MLRTSTTISRGAQGVARELRRETEYNMGRFKEAINIFSGVGWVRVFCFGSLSGLGGSHKWNGRVGT